MSHVPPARALRTLLAEPPVRVLLRAAAGLEIHLVGGVLRDRALGLPCHDFDAVVAGGGLALAHRLEAALPARLVLLGGKEFAAYRLVAKGATIDLWDRGEMPLERDLERRDFTVNALALEIATGRLVDPFGGLADLDRRILRATAARNFVDDPLRVLRLVRLALQLPGFAAEPATLRLAHAAAAGVGTVAAERVRDELERVFSHPDAPRGLGLLAALDLYPGLWVGRPGEARGSTGGALGEIERLPGVARRVREFLGEGAPRVDLRMARLAATFAHLPSEQSSALRVERFFRAGYLTGSDARDLKALLAEPRLPEGEIERRRFLHRLGPLWGTAACSLAARAAAASPTGALPAALTELCRTAEREGSEVFDPPRLVTAGDLQEILGIAPGPKLGEVLRALRAAQVDGKARTRDELLALARNV